MVGSCATYVTQLFFLPRQFCTKQITMNFLNWLKEPWPWYVSGPLIGLVIPVLLLLGNKSLGISSSFRHICAVVLPARIPLFRYNWKKERWNLFFVAGIVLGGFIAVRVLNIPGPESFNTKLVNDLQQAGINRQSGWIPGELFNWPALFTLKGMIMIIVSGFLIGFGARYAGGCTSGHAIMGLSQLQWPSLVATGCFMISGVLTSNFILPLILQL